MTIIATIVKIKIDDASNFRRELDSLYESTSQIILAKWSLELAKHILDMVGYDLNPIILEGFSVNQAWQNGEARMHDVRQTGFKIHALAKSVDNEIHKTALRVVGQAVGTGHMREHAMVASDYAIKVVNLLSSNDMNATIQERKWQINTLKNELLKHTKGRQTNKKKKPIRNDMEL